MLKLRFYILAIKFYINNYSYLYFLIKQTTHYVLQILAIKL